MAYTCEPHARQVADFLGFACDDAHPVGAVRSPLGLEHWTMPLLEVLIIAGAVFALVHAWRRWRRDGDPVNLGLWFASLIYLAVIEPPLYFPEWFGLQDYVGFIFSHNVFTVQFMFDRLPLYIVAFYPVISQITYELVRALGIFARRGAAVGAIATAFASQVFYEIFDQLGPQLKWWAWNPENMINTPMFASVPMNSMWVFASVSFGVMVWLVVKLLGGPARTGTPMGGGSLAWRTLVAGVLTPVLMVILAAPTRVGVDAEGEGTLQKVILWTFLGLLWLVGLWLLADGTRRTWRGSAQPVSSPAFVRIYPAAYVVVHALFWIAALPAFLGATDGVTSDGTPVGSGWYALACFAVAAWFVVAAILATRTRARAAGTSGSTTAGTEGSSTRGADMTP
ncbi:hypothetical protein [Dietzia sp. PP-33]|jgi:hypothetical protein|uniref:hypothetical protein n=1 Tax=Dietzia sp. PP-33 TaxID=2957500 RepID=UPI0029B9E937|nr:hypothetical protein [Dietzia sp. PP-33]MDX2356739.1 hypothetical protein [Dietzia sp. PP-33]